MKLTLTLTLGLISITNSSAQGLVVDPSFASSSTYVGQGVTVMALQSDGKIVCGGGFDAYSGTAREDLVRLHTDGTVDAGFAPMPTMGSGASVQALHVQPDGKVLVAGAFAEMNGVPATGLAPLEPTGANDAGFNHSIDGYVFAVAALPNGNVFVGGDIFEPTAGILALSSTGTTVAYPPLVPSTRCLRVQPDGKVLVGLSDTPYLARLEQDGTLDATFTPSIGAMFGSVVDIAMHSDGRITVVGDFTSVDGQPRGRIARLLPDGDLDVSFDPGLGLDAMAIAVDTLPGGDILVGGYFTSYDGASTLGNLLRLNSSGTLVSDLPASDIIDIRVQPDGKVLLSGGLMNYDGEFRNGVMRLMPDVSSGVVRAATDAVRAWPSPAEDVLNMSGLEPGAWLTVMDAAGRSLLRTRHSGGVLPVGALAPGTYVVTWAAGHESGQVRFMKR